MATGSAQPVKCQHCKSGGSSLLDCTGCFEVVYCNSQCQLNDWPNHKRWCPRKTPGYCAHCGTYTIQKCTVCRIVPYCSKACRKAHMKQHKYECRANVANMKTTDQSEAEVLAFLAKVGIHQSQDTKE